MNSSNMIADRFVIILMINSAFSKDTFKHGVDDSRQWFQGTLGQAVLLAEHQMIGRVLPDLFGYHILQIGAPGETQFLDSSRIQHKVITDRHQDTQCAGVTMISDSHALPLGSDNVDVIVLPHLLEFDTNPHQALREMERVLIGDGHVVIIGFNPWSLWGLWRLFHAWRDRYPWNGKFISMTRLSDLLALLDFEVIRTEYFFYRPPLANFGISKKLEFMEQLGSFCWRYLGGIYLLAAKKRVIPMTPVRIQWQKRRHMLAPGVAEHTTRNWGPGAGG